MKLTFLDIATADFALRAQSGVYNSQPAFPARLKVFQEAGGRIAGRPFIISLFEHQEFF